MALIPANSRLPSLPTETHAHVLSYCDAQTLGRACLVSFAFLELAGPLLYEHINITGFAQLESMFYNEERVSSAPHLDRCLSLDQTRTFTFVGLPRTLLAHTLWQSRKDSSSCSTRSVRRARSPSRSTPSIPIDAALASTSVPDVCPLIVYLDDAPWTRLRTILLGQIDPSGHMSELPFFGSLPSGSLTVTFDLAHDHDMSDYLVYCFVGMLCPRWEGDATKELLSPGWPQVKEVVVKVNSNEQKEWIVDYLRQDWDARFDLSTEERDRREAMIRYVVA